ncbi:hypothetical protein ADK60_18730 [Streptomyces sp. XY431]|nr:hypothetical protein ADK60_18730 [Streptomyces sp. XY431]
MGAAVVERAGVERAGLDELVERAAGTLGRVAVAVAADLVAGAVPAQIGDRVLDAGDLDAARVGDDGTADDASTA